MNPGDLAFMLFVLILVAMVGGFILLRPIVRRVGAAVEQRMDGKAPAGITADQYRQLEAAVNALRNDLEILSESQAFTEVIAGRQTRGLPTENR